jgi:TBC1 domain family protein 5
LASTLGRPPSFGSSSYPLLHERPSTERYGEFASARDLAELRQQNKHLGESVAWILETLNRGVDEQDGQGAWEVQRKQSLESLSYVRDVLSGQINQIDERRLWGEAEFKRRWEARETSPQATTGRSGSPQDGRRPTLNTSIPSSVNETLRGFISSNAPLGVSATPDHSRSASSGMPVVSRATLPRAPMRVSVNNPFQRVTDGGNVTRAEWSVVAGRTVAGSDASPDVRNQVVPVQHDPLGVLR